MCLFSALCSFHSEEQRRGESERDATLSTKVSARLGIMIFLCNFTWVLKFYVSRNQIRHKDKTGKLLSLCMSVCVFVCVCVCVYTPSSRHADILCALEYNFLNLMFVKRTQQKNNKAKLSWHPISDDGQIKCI